MGQDASTGANYDHRKAWIEEKLLQCAAVFGIDLIAFAILDNHYHCVLRSRPDVVATWDDYEVARRWLTLCPIRRDKRGKTLSPNEGDIKGLSKQVERITAIRKRLSDISWWMRMVNQPIAVRANREDRQEGEFWRARYRSIRLLDEASILACAVYVDLNSIRAAVSDTIEGSLHTSARLRAIALRRQRGKVSNSTESHQANQAPVDAALAPVCIKDRSASPVTPQPSSSGLRASDKGFASMSSASYLALLDWTARQRIAGKSGATPPEFPPLFERLGITESAWAALTRGFEDLFCQVAGQPKAVDACFSRLEHHRFYMPTASRDLFAAG